MKIQTSRFGEKILQKEDIIYIKEGLLGFEAEKQYFIVDPGDETLVLWMQSVKDPNLAFPIIEPRIFNPNYSVHLLPSELHSLELEDQTDVKAFCILTIPKDITLMTANLKAPVFLNTKKNTARQIVLQDNTLKVKQEIYNELKKMIILHKQNIANTKTGQLFKTPSKENNNQESPTAVQPSRSVEI